jgi:hypothetical protein
MMFSSEIHIQQVYLHSIFAGNTDSIAFSDFMAAVKSQGIDNPIPMLSLHLHSFGNSIDLKDYLPETDPRVK